MLKPDLDEILAEAKIERTQRAEELSFDQWVALYDVFSQRLKTIHNW